MLIIHIEEGRRGLGLENPWMSENVTCTQPLRGGNEYLLQEVLTLGGDRVKFSAFTIYIYILLSIVY
jgi:hypothetical protein